MGWESTGPDGLEAGAVLALEPQAPGSSGPVPSPLSSEVNKGRMEGGETQQNLPGPDAFPVTVVTKCHRSHDLQNQEFVLSQFGGQKSEVKARGVGKAAPPEALGEEPSWGLPHPGPYTRGLLIGTPVLSLRTTLTHPI